MPLMTEPLAHVEGVLGTVEFDIKKWKLERTRIDARLEVLEDLQSRLRGAIESEREKLSPSSTRAP